MANVKHKKKKQRFILSSRQSNILIGSILGDANVHRKGKECRFFFKHSFNQLPLLQWKRLELNNITGMTINEFKQEVKGKSYKFAQFVTLTHPSFTELYKIFYRNKKKIVPKNINKLLTHPLSLGVWIMDDGAKDNVGMTIQTHSFTRNEVKRLIAMLKKNFCLTATIRLNKKKYIIYLPQSQITKLWNIVKDYILPEYKYKFPVTP